MTKWQTRDKLSGHC